MCPYVTSFLLSGGMSDLVMKKIVDMPLTSQRPCAMRPSLLAKEVDYCSRSSGCLIRSWYPTFLPVVLLIIIPEKQS